MTEDLSALATAVTDSPEYIAVQTVGPYSQAADRNSLDLRRAVADAIREARRTATWQAYVFALEEAAKLAETEFVMGENSILRSHEIEFGIRVAARIRNMKEAICANHPRQ